MSEPSARPPGIRPRTPAHDPEREPAPHPSLPSAQFTWGIRAGVAVYLVVQTVLATVQGLPADSLVRSRVGVLIVSALVLGATASGLWRWAGQPRLTRAEQSRIGTVLGSETARTVRRALRRGQSLPEELQPWARAQATAARELYPSLAVMLIVLAGWVMATAGDDGFPHWIPLGLMSCYLPATTAVQINAARQRRHAARLSVHAPIRG